MKKLFIALLTIFTMSSAFAGATTRCTNLANFAYSVATARNSGVEQSQLQTQVFNLIDEGKVKQFVAYDKVELGRIITILYNHPSATPEYASQSYFQHCMQTTEDI